MLNHTYTSVKNANLVDCGKKQHIPSQPSPLLKDNFLGEFRTELDKKKVLANLGIATSLSLEWEYIKGDIGRSEALMQELDSRTTYISAIDGFQKSLVDGIKYLESVVGGEEEGEEEQNNRLNTLESLTSDLVSDLEEVKDYLTETIEVDIDSLEKDLETITEKVNNITDLIQVSSKAGNALRLVTEEELGEGETPGLYVPDLSETVNETSEKVITLQEEVTNIKDSLDEFVTKSELGGDGFEFVDKSDYDSFVNSTSDSLSDIREELKNTVKTGEDGHVDTLYVNKISKNNDDGNIVITDSLEVSSGIPLDIRFVRENLEELYALPVKVCYPGMGVIVNSLSALYILRKPGEGVTFNQDYISNPHNWKCPEDLVTVALTREEYDNLPEKNEHVFYYIYEEEIARTQEPKREDFDSEEAFKVAWQEWVDSLKILSQEYMSASWGVNIEKALSNKASMDSVSALAKEIDSIKGDGSGTSLDSLSADISELQSQNEILETRIDDILIIEDEVEKGRLVDVEARVTTIETDLESYVTEEELKTLSGDFNFVKPDDYEKDKEEFATELAKELTTEKVTTESVVLSGTSLSNEGGTLIFNSNPIAKVSDIPVIEVLPQEEYDKLTEKDEDTYYYTFDTDNIYVTKSELETKISGLQQQIQALLSKIDTLEKTLNNKTSGSDTGVEN